MVSRLSALFALLACVFVLTAGLPVESQYVETMTFQDGVSPTVGYAGCEATFINSSAADSGKNFGAADTLWLSSAAWAGPFHAGTSKILIKFDLGALPDSAVIVEAKLHMYQRSNNTGNNTDTLAAFRVYPPWTEGTGAQGGTASVASATWTTRHATDNLPDVFTTGNWGANGASLLSTGAASKLWNTASDSTVGVTSSGFNGSDTLDVKSSALGSAGSPLIDRVSEGVLGLAKTGAGAGARSGWLTFEVTAQVSKWHTAANTNNGFILEAHNSGNNKAFQYFSDNYADLPYRPKLVVKYIDPEEIEAAGGGGGSSARRVIGNGTGPR